MSITVNAFYKFVEIEAPEELAGALREKGVAHGVKGTILLGSEGINATISGTAEGMRAMMEAILTDTRFSDAPVKTSYHDAHPFRRFKVKIKREILTFGIPQANPAQQTGIYVKPEAWNALIQDPNVTLIDTRNAYECAIGTFKNAIDPGTKRFGDFIHFAKEKLDPQRQTKIALFCTGGIRCEKASSFLLMQGFKDVFQLEGGILNYLEQMPVSESLWEGECFVFDERVAVDSALEQGATRLCIECGAPVSNASGGLNLAYTAPQPTCAACAVPLSQERSA